VEQLSAPPGGLKSFRYFQKVIEAPKWSHP